MFGAAVCCAAGLAVLGHARAQNPLPADSPTPRREPPRPPVELERTPTGFYYPTGSAEAAHSKLYFRWKERDAAHGGTFYRGLYHLGHDFPAPGPQGGKPGAPVYAIADGTVLAIHRGRVGSKPGLQPGDSALFVRHVLRGGRPFVALYLHVRPSVPATDRQGRQTRVRAGQQIATVGPWKDGPHLHFGILAGSRVPGVNVAARRWWEKMGEAHWPDTNGFVDPVKWLEDPSHLPGALWIGPLAQRPGTPALPVPPAPAGQENASTAETGPRDATRRRLPGEVGINLREKAPMVYVPPGQFSMGAQNGQPDERPIHRVRISRGFWLYRTEVTNAAFRQFVQAAGRPLPAYLSDPRCNGPEQPALVSWTDARAYAKWAGGRLPTEAEWEYAARGTDQRRYPWGDQAPDSTRAVFGLNVRVGAPAPCGLRPAGASPFGALDMAGNVAEWCQDSYDAAYYAASALLDPRGPSAGPSRVVRGGSWFDQGETLRASNRFDYDPEYRGRDVGFRVLLPDAKRRK